MYAPETSSLYEELLVAESVIVALQLQVKYFLYDLDLVPVKDYAKKLDNFHFIFQKTFFVSIN